MIRHHWTPRMLCRAIKGRGWDGTPSVAIRWRRGPTGQTGERYRPHQLADLNWPTEIVAAFEAIDRCGQVNESNAQGSAPNSWKYIDIIASQHGAMVIFKAYFGEKGKHVRGLMPALADLIHLLQARGLRAEVNV